MRSSLLLLGLLSLSPLGFAENPRPNVVVLLADDLGFSDLSCYREDVPAVSARPSLARTPNLDQLARGGVRFTDFYAGASVCSPSRGALLTGRNATRLGLYNWVPADQPMHLRSEEETIAEVLGAHGYETGHFGKWHLTAEGTDQPLPMDQGFDDAFYTYNNALPSHRDPINFLRNGERVGPLKGYSCQVVVEEAVAWLRSLDAERPFFLNLWFHEPHEKLAAPEELKSHYAYRPEYYGCIENLDRAVGRLLAYLQTSGELANTIIVFSSDNGSQEPGSNDPLRGFKCFNYDGGVRVPFIVQWLDRLPGGQVSAAPGSFCDVLPTLVSLLELEHTFARPPDGVDLSGQLTQPAAATEREAPIFFYRYFHDPICMLREGDWVLLGYEEPPARNATLKTWELALLQPDPGMHEWSMWGFQKRHMAYLQDQRVHHYELYDIRADPGQQRDVADAHPSVVARLRSKMNALKAEMVAEGGDWYAGRR